MNMAKITLSLVEYINYVGGNVNARCVIEEEAVLNAAHIFYMPEQIVPLRTLMTASWTVDDKRTLLMLLQRHGASNLEIIQQNMPHKTISEIRFICEKHTKLALNKWCLEEGKKPKENHAVNDWLQILKQLNSVHKGPVQDIIPRVLKYIALYEKQLDNSHICLSDCYLVLSDISNGLASKNLDEISNHFFFECLTKLAEALKNGEIESYKDHLRNLKDLNAILNRQQGKKGGSATLNPLNIPNDLLKMTEVDKLVNILE